LVASRLSRNEPYHCTDPRTDKERFDRCTGVALLRPNGEEVNERYPKRAGAHGACPPIAGPGPHELTKREEQSSEDEVACNVEPHRRSGVRTCVFIALIGHGDLVAG